MRTRTAAALPVTGSHFCCRATQGEASRLPAPSRQDLSAAGKPSRASDQPVWSLRATSCSHFLRGTPGRLCSSPGTFGPRVASGHRLPSSSVTSRFRGSPIALQLSEAGSARGERLDRCLCVSAAYPPGPEPQPGSPAGLGHGGPRSSPPAPALRSLPPSSSGVGEVRLGRSVAGALVRRLAPAGLGQVAGGIMSGILAPPGNPAFPNAGRPWRDLPSNKVPARENRPACKLELKYLGELSASHFLPKGSNCPADHETKRIETL